jgi:hypothetical protein
MPASASAPLAGRVMPRGICVMCVCICVYVCYVCIGVYVCMCIGRVIPRGVAASRMPRFRKVPGFNYRGV